MRCRKSWEGPKSFLDAVKKKNFCQLESNSNYPFAQPLTWSLL
jgi:hypothetical protein